MARYLARLCYYCLMPGPSVQKAGVSPSRRRTKAGAIRSASRRVKDKKQQRILDAIAKAIEDGEAREACTLYGKLSPEGRKAMPGNTSKSCRVESKVLSAMYLLV